MNTVSSAVSPATWISRPAPRAALAPSSRYGQRLHSSFRPHPLLRGAHLQTMASLLRPAPKLVLRCERLELPDGDFLDLGWSGDHNKTGPLAVLVHGLCGGFESKYARGTACQLIAQGWRTVILQLRGAGPEPNRLQRCYDQGDTEDLRYFWHLLRNREPHAFIASVGWSLGGNVTLKALAEEGNAAPVDIAAAASVPFDIRPCAERLRTGFSRLYQKRLLYALKDALRRKHLHIAPSPLVNLAAALAARDFIEYDEAYTAPLAGYRDAEDYYTHSSCGRLLRNIRCPTLVVHALDDPFMTADIVPALDALAPCVTLEVAQSGGHVGFVSAGALGLPYCWLERRLTAYLHDGYKGRVGAHVHPVAIQSAARGRSQSDFYPAPATTLGLAMATST
ncbi:MAG: hydrolase [Steroidobacteraceae bacterium]|nr:hydrolase [Steroidobacteraceae bacterium]MBP9129264.1 hydrolase [Steroidobacteraceae bacterium]